MKVGSIVNDYKLQERIGSGRKAVIYKASADRKNTAIGASAMYVTTTGNCSGPWGPAANDNTLTTEQDQAAIELNCATDQSITSGNGGAAIGTCSTITTETHYFDPCVLSPDGLWSLTSSTDNNRALGSYTGSMQIAAVAIKSFRAGNDDAFLREARVLEMIGGNNKNIINHESIIVEHNCIVYPLCVPLSKAVRKCVKTLDLVPFNNVMTIMRDIFNGLDYLHSAGIVHGDIKRSNILMSRDVDLAANGAVVNAMIADLEGCALSEFDTINGSTHYLAPELLIESGHSSAVDIWASVCMAYELATDSFLFDVYGECVQQYGEDLDEVALEGLDDSSSDDGNDKNVPDDKNNSNGDGVSIVTEGNMPGIKINNKVHSGADSSDEDHCCNDESDESDSEKCVDCSVCSTDTDESSGSEIITDCSDSGDSEDDLDERCTIYRHLLIMEKLLGRPNTDFMALAPDYFQCGLLTGPSDTPNAGRQIEIKVITIRDLIDYNFAYSIIQYNRGLLADFVGRGLDYVPSERATAREMIEWIDRAHLV